MSMVGSGNRDSRGGRDSRDSRDGRERGREEREGGRIGESRPEAGREEMENRVFPKAAEL
jgi:hypothetical protein